MAGRAIPGYSTGAKVTGVLSAGALGATVFYGLNLGKGDRAADRAGFWPQYVRDRISATYSYLFQSLLITGKKITELFIQGNPPNMCGYKTGIKCGYNTDHSKKNVRQ